MEHVAHMEPMGNSQIIVVSILPKRTPNRAKKYK
jgi:hypothetical protein